MKLNVFWVMLMLFAGLLTFTACGPEVDRQADEAADEMQDVGEAVGDEMQQETAELRQDMEEARVKVNNRIQELQADLEGATAEARADIQQEIDRLQAYSRTLDERMERLGQNMETGWDRFREDVRNTLRDIDREIEGDI